MSLGDGTGQDATWAGLQLGEQQAGRDATQAELLGELWGLTLDLHQAFIASQIWRSGGASVETCSPHHGLRPTHVGPMYFQKIITIQ